jgi:glycosyl transferase family 25
MGIEDIDWVLLTAESKPERLKQFNSDNGHLGLQVEIVSATEAGDIDLRELAQIELISPEAADWDRGAVANALSHWLCWHQAVESGRPAGVLQDNAVLRRDFNARVRGLLSATPEGWEFLKLGYNTHSGIDFQITPDCRYRGQFAHRRPPQEDLDLFAATITPVTSMRLFTAFGAFAYIVTPSGAQRLIDSCFPLATRALYVPALHGRIRTTGIDGVMNQYYGAMQAFVSFPPLALSRGEQAPKMLSVEVGEPVAQAQ